ncbi:hypothetical protein E2C01_090561 [Portunus trituberculatus]|uniref:Uncharacterized protein n=1 Tax=Portunus trituberculatus TaxID=210409 RepID=A0A5B7JSR2_PORTR|nr:hypothetical protein [Portunus trituberculatus]
MQGRVNRRQEAYQPSLIETDDLSGGFIGLALNRLGGADHPWSSDVVVIVVAVLRCGACGGGVPGLTFCSSILRRGALVSDEI